MCCHEGRKINRAGKKLIRNAKHRLLHQRDTIRRTDDAALGDLAAGNNLLHAQAEAGLSRVTKKFFKGHNMGKLLIPRLMHRETHRMIFLLLPEIVLELT